MTSLRIRTAVSCLLFCTLLPVRLAGAADEESRWSTQQPKVQQSITRAADAVSDDTSGQGPKTSGITGGPAPQWIWGGDGDGERFTFRKSFPGSSKAATLLATCDNAMTVYLNEQRVASSSEWQTPVKLDVQKFLKAGENTLRIDAANQGGQAGLLVKLVLEAADGSYRYVITDDSWQAAPSSDADRWATVRTLGELGVEPWGDVLNNPGSELAGSTAPNVFEVLPGFQVELLYTVPREQQGSWVSLCVDNKGRLIASDQGEAGLYRITPPPIGSDVPTKVEKLDVNLTSAQGLLYAFDGLYVSVNGGPGSGFYRARDTDGDDQFDDVQKLKEFRGGGEHGPHAVRLSPDGRVLHVICGNHTDPPAEHANGPVPSNWDEDLLLPRQWDARGHARGRLAPGGWIARTDPDGQTWEIFSIGYRNAYDMDFNADGELYAYDADMEWDMGTPWYRPTRVVHATSGSEFGWRSGTGKWPPYYVDSLPQLIDIGPGSPVGVTFGYGAKFPARYQRAMFILDWTFGTIYAIHTTPSGASYTAVKEEFLSRTPLPLTDAVIGSDGALYFTIGGRNTQSELFRVSYMGDDPTDAVDATNKEGAELRTLRRRLEALHGPPDGKNTGNSALDLIWPQLGHEDRHIRYAARVALEFQDPATWQDRLLAEQDPETLITGMVALARQGHASFQARALAALARLDYGRLSPTQQIELLRVYQLVFIRMGEPDARTAAALATRLDPFYPAETDALNRELCNLLVYLNSPTVITKTLDLMQRVVEQTPEDMAELLARNRGYGGTIARMLSNLPEIQKIHYAFALRNMRYGWTLEQREKYFDWFNGALQRSGGASYEGFLQNIRSEAMDKLSAAEKAALEGTLRSTPIKASEIPKPQGPGHDWTLDEVVQLASGNLSNRNFEHGKRSFAAARCIICHRFDGEGRATGPDLSNVAGRFSLRDLTESIIDPSKTVSDQYKASVILTADSKLVSGRIVGEDDDAYTVMTNPEDATQIARVAKDDIEEIMPSKTSLMPTDLLKPLNRDEVLDMIAYLMSRGNPNDPMFAD